MGFAEPHRSPGVLVVSYTTVSPLPGLATSRAVCFLWHWPADYSEWALPTILPCGARTFLGADLLAQVNAAMVWPTRPFILSILRWVSSVLRQRSQRGVQLLLPELCPEGRWNLFLQNLKVLGDSLGAA